LRRAKQLTKSGHSVFASSALKFFLENDITQKDFEENPTVLDYSYFSYRFNSRKKNIGWRIDYFLINKKYIKNIKKSLILTEILGSDHTPIKLEFKL
jgi:exodeoxyribonuclease-3